MEKLLETRRQLVLRARNGPRARPKTTLDPRRVHVEDEPSLQQLSFDDVDRNHDGVIDRGEWDLARRRLQDDNALSDDQEN